MTKRKREAPELLESPTSPAVPNQQPSACQEASLPTGQSTYVDVPLIPSEVATDATSAAEEGAYGPFWALLAQAGYTVWDQSG